jgi:hypothetical protein
MVVSSFTEGGLAMNTEFNVRHIEAPQQLTNPQVPSEATRDLRNVDLLLQNPEQDSTTAGLVAVYSDLLMLQALALDHFQKPADELIQPEQKKEESKEL